MPGPVELLNATPGLSDWTVSTRQGVRDELYFGPTRTDATRRVEEAEAEITIYKDRGAERGRAQFRVTPGREAELARRLKEAEAQAALGGQPKWSFPPKPTVYPKVPLLDLDVRNGGEFLPNRARSDIESGLATVKGVRLAQAEAFIAKERLQVVTSTGSAAGDDTSRLSLTIVLLAGAGAQEQERLFTLTRRRYQDLDLPAAVAREAQRALDRVAATAPTAGATPVLFGGPVIGRLLRWVTSGASGQSVFQKESPLTVGQSIYPDGRCDGDALTLELNATFPFGPASYRIDDDGLPGTNVRVIDAGKFVTPHAGPQYAAYLKLAAPSGRPGTPQFPPGKTKEADLRRGDHLEVVQFSDLVPSGQGNFSAEIRLGYEVRKGKRRPVTGGVVSGNILAALAHAHYSEEVGLEDAYVGPRWIRVESSLKVGV